jgi:hypothetical protein
MSGLAWTLASYLCICVAGVISTHHPAQLFIGLGRVSKTNCDPLISAS